MTVNQTTTVPPLIFPATGTVVAQVNFARGAPAANATVYLTEQATGRSRYGRQYLSTDDTGAYEVTGVPEGLVQVTAEDATNYRLVGIATGTVVKDATTTVNVTFGSATYFEY